MDIDPQKSELPQENLVEKIEASHGEKKPCELLSFEFNNNSFAVQVRRPLVLRSGRLL